MGAREGGGGVHPPSLGRPPTLAGPAAAPEAAAEADAEADADAEAVAPAQASEATLAADIDAADAQQRTPQRIVDKFELRGALHGGDDEEDDDFDDDDDDDSAEMSPVNSETVLHGTPPRASKLKQFVEQGRV
ncbi:hypothetical protein GGI19_004950 [Coemansia pectinata]|uniref:Uncharacterized protein n=1 Tax=Coemansia pectinata TaxID=1052879 RepID=A0A9W8GRU3_9FUNG|nr:hypothetical protein GGI19_004950 [Coemansia pectinata]